MTCWQGVSEIRFVEAVPVAYSSLELAGLTASTSVTATPVPVLVTATFCTVAEDSEDGIFEAVASAPAPVFRVPLTGDVPTAVIFGSWMEVWLGEIALELAKTCATSVLSFSPYSRLQVIISNLPDVQIVQALVAFHLHQNTKDSWL
mmetsp:Transcript_31044/g.56272  ORF Transcript_31044/g.56272 Transcript_31044/m.56272 type:complete len:147 (+) Transcript_31044:151-591(+)